MTSWIVGHTSRFRAAASERAVNAPASLFGTSDIGYWFEAYEVGGDPLTNPELYWQRSPLSYAGSITTPLLILHSENDLRCPIEQAEQLYVALKKNGVPAKVIQYAGQPHGITGSWNIVHRMLNERRWMDKYVKGKDVM